MQTVVISGLSGSGKSWVSKTFEDLGFYCVDNLPVPLLKFFFELVEQSAEEIHKIAVVVDARDRAHIGELPQFLDKFSKEGWEIDLLFLEASDEVLSRRFSETRHRHPLSPNGSVMEGIQTERALLKSIRNKAKIIIDSSDFSVHDLRKKIIQIFECRTSPTHLAVSLSSFGYKHGVPRNADLVLDVRFLTNPYFREDLKKKNGIHPEVIQFVMEQEDAKEFLSEMKRLFSFLVPRFQREGKSYLQVAIGCTGGQHRSVVMASQMEVLLQGLGCKTSTQHRDMIETL